MNWLLAQGLTNRCVGEIHAILPKNKIPVTNQRGLLKLVGVGLLSACIGATASGWIVFRYAQGISFANVSELERCARNSYLCTSNDESQIMMQDYFINVLNRHLIIYGNHALSPNLSLAITYLIRAKIFTRMNKVPEAEESENIAIKYANKLNSGIIYNQNNAYKLLEVIRPSN